MKWALVNPAWTFDGSIYFGCHEPHLPLEFGYSQALLEAAGEQVRLLDAGLCELSVADLRAELAVFKPDFLVVPTAPSYLFWRCPPPELRVPRETIAALRDLTRTVIAVGPHASTTPGAALRKLDADLAVLGECEEVLPRLAATDRVGWEGIDGIAYRQDGRVVSQGCPQAANMATLPPLRWPDALVHAHVHHHHRFDTPSAGPAAEIEASRGCPYACTFCAKDNFRDRYRRRPLGVILEELDALIRQGVRYVYFIDEIFLPNRELLAELAVRDVRFGVQTRIDLWKPEMLDALGAAGCVSIEAGVESVSDAGRRLLDKDCRLTTEQLTERLVHAKRSIAFVQASLLDSLADDPQGVEQWRQTLLTQGVWANEPVPMYPYPGSPDYTRLWGTPDEQAWERAHEHYLEQFTRFSDIQEERPLPLKALEG
jgi:anaerobic magnesium-protoporphyrin IX monomethyl ester cyclase